MYLNPNYVLERRNEAFSGNKSGSFIGWGIAALWWERKTDSFYWFAANEGRNRRANAYFGFQPQSLNKSIKMSFSDGWRMYTGYLQLVAI